MIGDHFWLPRDDNDTTLKWGDNDGDYLFSDPADPNIPIVDHRSDEQDIWHFNKDSLAQDVIQNLWLSDPKLAAMDN